MEFVDVDLKRYMDTANKNKTPITLDISKVRLPPSNNATFPIASF